MDVPIETLIFLCAKQLADEEVISEELLFELYKILRLYFEGKPTVH